MRIAVFTAASMLAMAPVAYGQTDTGSAGGAGPYSASPPGSASGTTSYSDQGDRPVGAPASTQPDPNNCGTPDEPKPCGSRAHRAR
jgi:hypothetical protein